MAGEVPLVLDRLQREGVCGTTTCSAAILTCGNFFRQILWLAAGRMVETIDAILQ